MIDHKSIINQRVDTSLEKRHGDNASVETHELNPTHSPLPNGASASAEVKDNPPGEPKAIFDSLIDHKLKIRLSNQ